MTQESRPYGFEFNGRHSSEFELVILNDKSVTLPAKRKYQLQLPYRTGYIDLSNLYGLNTYDERTVTFPCRLPYGQNNLSLMNIKLTELMNWLMKPTGKIMLKDDAMPGYAFLAEVQTAPTIEEGWDFCKVTIVFQCYAYRLKHCYDDVWDTFCFDLDAASNIEADVKGHESILLINTGQNCAKLTINCSSAMSASVNDHVFALKAGDNVNPYLELMPGENTVNLEGTGHVRFDWTEEWL
ncbi:hypothetical protein [Ligilactobacillus ruminis]|uniref:Phage tail protein n=2 Tax=Ligilactobacillus ruminis TaxID=1623 RepID=A0A837IT56_9LACO|nr:hypothetical protein [Ligilactobacillus ruminis]KLA47031.1 hypothetical protein LRB_474 [Ligilactobacillus ruminis]SFG40850.1 hypothetical protein SAMN02910432_01232 [Ligilactobacillus ruminis DSM 20403 = NBRC 102161]